MSQCSQNTTDFIKSTFGPKIAVVASDDAEAICRQNGLSVVELLKPFSKLNTEFQIRDPTNTPHSIKGLHLSFSDPFKPAESVQVFKKLINDDISNNYTPGNMAVSVKGYQVKQSCPWYEAFRELYFQYFQSQEHDSVMHYLACVIFVSASESDPIGRFQALTESVMKAPIKWVDNDMLCYHVLVHDQTKKTKTTADQLMQSLSTLYGPATCHLLRLHQKGSTDSEAPGPNPWRQFARERLPGSEFVDTNALTLLQMAIDDESEGETVDPLGATAAASEGLGEANLGPNPLQSSAGKQCGEKLTISDQSAIRSCINDFVVRGLLPFNERRMRALNEALNTRRGLRGTLFSATKKLFSTGPKPTGKVPSNPGYLTDSPEILLRRLGDISFLLQHYTMAYNSYHSVKRDFQNDQAYNHYAAALEMTSLSLFMGSGTRREPHTYYEECINVYMNLCKSPLYAMRATLVHCECLISRGLFQSAAVGFIKMTNDEADLYSGLLLEQGAHCYVRMETPCLRKYAFHLVLSGHRYSKAGQRKHALRCYRNAWSIFQGKGWGLAENHIGFTIGRHSYNIRDIDGAYEAYKSLLTNDDTNVHVMHSQILFQKGVQDFVSVVQMYLQSQPDGTTIELPIPLVNFNRIDVSLFGKPHAGIVKQTTAFEKEKRQRIVELEEKAYAVMVGGPFFKPHQTLFSGETLNTQRPICAINETVTILIPLRNPLQIPITLSNIALQCLHREEGAVAAAVAAGEDGPPGRVATKDQVSTSMLEQLVLAPEEDLVISLSVTPHQQGQLTITALNYHLVSTKTLDSANKDASVMENMIPGRISLFPRGPRLNNTKEQRVGEVYGTDNRLNLLVTPPLPRLELDTTAIPGHLYCGEVKCAVVKATNQGEVPLTNLCLANSYPHIVALGEVKLEPFSPIVHPTGGTSCHVIDQGHVVPSATPVALPRDNLLLPGETAYIALWLYGGEEAGSFDLVTTLYYTPVDSVAGVSHRSVSGEKRVNVTDSVTCESRVHSITPTREQRLELVGSVVVNNVGYYSVSLQDLNVTQLGLVSDRWIIQSLDCSIPLVVYPGASINIPFKAELTERAEATEKQSPAHLSCVALGGGPLIRSSEDHVLDLYRRSQACFQANQSGNQGEEAGTTVYRMGLILFWEGTVAEEGGRTRTLHAQHHTFVQAPLLPQPTQMLSLCLSYQERWVADFKSAPLLPVTVTLNITNCYKAPLTVVVDANTTAGRAEGQKSVDTLPFIWSGMVRHRLQLEDHVTTSVDLTAIFTQPGVYNINQISVEVEDGEGARVPQTLSAVPLLRVDTL